MLPLAEVDAQPRRGLPPFLQDRVTVEKDLPYVKDGHERQKLDLYVPKQGEGPFPLVIWVHGGGWQNGSKDGGGPAIALLGEGYAVASINYRLSQHAQFPEQIRDCLAAVRYLRANAAKWNLDPDAFGAFGASAGGHLVALMGTAADHEDFLTLGEHRDVSAKVQCVVNWFGPADFASMGGFHNNRNSPEAKLLGGLVQEDLDRAKAASPVAYASAGDAPMLLMHGDADRIVPFHQSERLLKALEDVQVEARLIRIEGVGHGGPEFTNQENRQAILDFLAKHLK
jgi:acetyl esterase/lipase